MLKEAIKKVSRKRTYFILSLSDFQNHECYKKVIGHGYATSTEHLHTFGKLYTLMLKPQQFSPSFICIVKIGKSPVCAVTITLHNASSNKPSEPEFLKTAKNALVFPNVEIMAFTLEKFREKGLARFASKKLLESIKFPVNGQVYLYSETIKRVVEKIGFRNVRNLHED